MNAICGVVLLIAIPTALAAGEARSGKAIFSNICRTCHGPQGEGNPAVAKALKADIPDLRSKEVPGKNR